MYVCVYIYIWCILRLRAGGEGERACARARVREREREMNTVSVKRAKETPATLIAAISTIASGGPVPFAMHCCTPR
jgi:hypothetical protein